MELYKPMEPILINEIKGDDEFIHQIKWDGIRILSYKKNNDVRLFTKKGNEKTKQYPEILRSINFNANTIVLDGEVISIKDGKPSFYHVAARNKLSKLGKIEEAVNTNPVFYFIFDILFLNGKDLTQKSLEERTKILNDLIIESEHIKMVKNFPNGLELYDIVKEKRLEGIVSKRKSSIYIPGKGHNDWFKYKLSRKILSIVCGVNLNKEGKIKSLILGVKNGEKLKHIGSVSSGLNQKHLSLLREYSSQLKVNYNPFDSEDFNERDLIWFEPLITCWISFFEWTEDGTLRHPKLIGFTNKKGDEADGTEYVE